jgi:hypothetical protein
MTTMDPTPPKGVDDLTRRLDEYLASDPTPQEDHLMMAALRGLEDSVAAALKLAQSNDDMNEAVSTKVDDLTRRLDEYLASDPTPQEDHLQSVVESVLTGRMDNLMARLEEGERRVADAIASVPIALNERLGEQGGISPAQLAEFGNGMADLIAKTHDRIDRIESALTGGQSITAGAPQLGAARKVLELMRAVESIAKEKQANLGSGGRFKFRGIDDAQDAVGHAMRQVGLIMRTEVVAKDYEHHTVRKSTDNGPVEVLWTTATVTMRYVFVDPETLSEHPFEMLGEGRDASDKGSSKAASMACKYGLFQALMIPVNGLDDGDAESPQVTQPYQSPRQSPPEQPSQAPTSGPPAADQPQSTASRHDRAVAAVTAMRGIDRWPPAERMEKLAAIRDQIEREGLAAYEVEGITLRAHGIAVGRTLEANQ